MAVNNGNNNDEERGDLLWLNDLFSPGIVPIVNTLWLDVITKKGPPDPKPKLKMFCQCFLSMFSENWRIAEQYVNIISNSPKAPHTLPLYTLCQVYQPPKPWKRELLWLPWIPALPKMKGRKAKSKASVGEGACGHCNYHIPTPLPSIAENDVH